MRSPSSHSTPGLVRVVVGGFLVAAVATWAPARADAAQCERTTIGVRGHLIPVAYEGPADSAFTHALAAPYASADQLRAMRLPQGLATSDTQTRKTAFLNTVLPLLHQVNTRIAEERADLLDLQRVVQRGCELRSEERSWVEEIAAAYRGSPDKLDDLLARIDVLPLSVAAAQAAIESAWGTSRFAREGNALFGERTYDISIPGMKVAGRTAFRVRSFETLYDSVVQYAGNLNTHPAYVQFRSKRAEMRAKGLPLDGQALASTLNLYSEERAKYASTLVTIIRHNAFHHLDAITVAAIDPLAGRTVATAAE